jgi:hypothetical protein
VHGASVFFEVTPHFELNSCSAAQDVGLKNHD